MMLDVLIFLCWTALLCINGNLIRLRKALEERKP